MKDFDERLSHKTSSKVKQGHFKQEHDFKHFTFGD